MSALVEQEIRMRCVEQASVLSARLNRYDAKSVIELAEELCKYVINASGDAPSKKKKSPLQPKADNTIAT